MDRFIVRVRVRVEFTRIRVRVRNWVRACLRGR